MTKLATPGLALAMLPAIFLSLSADRSAAATVVSTVHYQTALTLNCTAGGQNCIGALPAVGTRRRLNIARITCYMRSAQYAAYASGQIEVRDAGGTSTLAQFLPADYSTDWGYHVINSAANLQILAGRHMMVSLTLAPGSGTAYEAACTAQGTLETLQ
jgi:hypothetical protein